jgi:hypothetical protein
MAAAMATKLSDVVLPEKMANMVKELAEMGVETEAIRNKLMSPLSGPLLPFCTKGYTFNLDRMMFCGQITKDIIGIAAGGAGLATLGITLLTAPDQVYAFFTEAFIPVLDELKAEGKVTFKKNMDKALVMLIGIDTDTMNGITLDQFMELTQNKDTQKNLQAHAPEEAVTELAQVPIQAPTPTPTPTPAPTPTRASASASTVSRKNCKCTCPVPAQTGGGRSRASKEEARVHRQIHQMTYRELQKKAKELGAPATGPKHRIQARISYLLL